MKKFITLILLLVFCIEPTCWAAEVIVGADGQARYADGTATPVVKQGVKVEKMKEANKNENVTQKLTIEKKADLDKVVKSYEKENFKIINKAEKTLNMQKLRNEWELFLYDPSSDIRIELQDGDYVIWPKSQKSSQYALERHKNGSLMGAVRVNKINSKTVVFYEYRIENNNQVLWPLKHIMIVYIDQHNATFIYTADKKLRSCKYDENIYAIDLAGFPDVQKTNINNIRSDGQEIVSATFDSVGGLIAAPFVIVGAPLLPLYLVLDFFFGKHGPH